MPTTDAQGRTISDDGQWWWDGSAWQPIKKGFFDTLADSVEGAVKKVEGSSAVNSPATAQAAASASASTADAAAVNAPAAAAPTATAPIEATPVAAAPIAAAPGGAESAPVVAQAPAPVPAEPTIPAADLLAYLGALKHAAVVTDVEFESIRRRIPGQA